MNQILEMAKLPSDDMIVYNAMYVGREPNEVLAMTS